MLTVFLLCLGLVALCLVGLGFNILFRKGGEFPQTEISSNLEMRKRGIRCAKEEEMRLWGKKHRKKNVTCADLGCTDCGGCEILNKS